MCIVHTYYCLDSFPKKVHNSFCAFLTRFGFLSRNSDFFSLSTNLTELNATIQYIDDNFDFHSHPIELCVKFNKQIRLRITERKCSDNANSIGSEHILTNGKINTNKDIKNNDNKRFGFFLSLTQ